MAMLEIHTPRDRRCIAVEDGGPSLTLAEVLRRADVPLNTRCGQRGLCDGCTIELLAGSLIRIATGRSVGAAEAAGPMRACQHRLVPGEPAAVRIPERSRLAHAPQVVTSFAANVSRAHDPLWQPVVLEADQWDEDVPVAEAVTRAVARQRDGGLPVRSARAAHRIEPSANGQLHLAIEHCGDHWSLFPYDSARGAFGVAADVGTTTVVVLLVNLADGEVVGTASALNAQIRFGDNVLTRIQHCRNDKRLVARLQQAVLRRTIAPLLEQILTEHGVSADQVVCLAVAGNTTMLHLLAGEDPSPMGVAPFTPVFLEHRVLRASQIPLWKSRRAAPETRAASPRSVPNGADDLLTDTRPPHAASPVDPAIHLLPGAAGYVGADVIAGVFSTGMIYRAETSLLVDMGTNGEIVLKHKDRMFACATAAGPAFEGAGLACGVRASRGAISHLRWHGESGPPDCEVIGDAEPIGLCGTAYVDFVAEARRIGLIRQTGRFATDRPGQRLVRHPTHGHAYIIARDPGPEPIVVCEADIAALLQAKAAIAAGILCLLHRVGLTAVDVQTLYLAGGFGFHMDVDNVLRCGLLPGFSPDVVQLVGNSSLAGAYLALLDSGVLAEMKQVCRRLEVIELNLEPGFEACYIDQLALPE